MNTENDVPHSLPEGALNEDANQQLKPDLEIRREAAGSERRDESVMGPPAAPFSMIPLQTNNQRNVPMGQDAPTSVQPPKLNASIPNEIQKPKEDDAKNDTDNLSGNHGPISYKENDHKNKKYRNKKDDKDSEYRSGKGKSRRHGNNRRSSTPDDEERESSRRRNRSPNSSFSSSSNDQSSDLSDSDDR